MTKARGRRAGIEEQIRLLMRGVEYGDENIRAAMEEELQERLKEGRPLRVYLGVDPSAPDLTLGHTVPMRKLRQFQDLGHETTFLIGNFTGLVGDPSDKESARRMLTPEELEANARTYTEQAFKVLDPERTIIRYNAEWLSKLTFADLIEIASHFTVGQFLQRDNFSARRERAEPIYLHEFFYALMQGYDAVAQETDVQIGATEQLFNLMAGRTLQRAYGQRPQVAVTLPVLVGTDGRLRMSKTQGNHIALNDPPDEMYGKVMSLPDDVMMDYFTLVTDVPEEGLAEMREQLTARSVNPMELKKRLGREIVAEYHGAEEAERAEERFETVFQQGQMPEDVPTEVFSFSQVVQEFPTYAHADLPRRENTMSFSHLLTRLGLAGSRSDARRLIRQGAVEVDGRVVDKDYVQLRDGMVIRVGKLGFRRIVDADNEK